MDEDRENRGQEDGEDAVPPGAEAKALLSRRTALTAVLLALAIPAAWMIRGRISDVLQGNAQEEANRQAMLKITRLMTAENAQYAAAEVPGQALVEKFKLKKAELEQKFQGAELQKRLWYAARLALASTHDKDKRIGPNSLREMLLLAGGTLDQGSGNVLIGKAAENLPANDPLIEVQIAGKTVNLRKGFADLLIQGNANMGADYAAKKESPIRQRIQKLLGHTGVDWQQIAIDDEKGAFRTNHHQYLTWATALDPTKDEPFRVSFRASPPGVGWHERGQAVDVDNWFAADEYLSALGIQGGFDGIDGDTRHFSIQEWEAPKGYNRILRITKHLASYEARRLGGKLKRKLREIFR